MNRQSLWLICLALLLPAPSCHDLPVVDAGTAGAFATGGSPAIATGGNKPATGGTLASTGGSPATGGQPCAPVAMPDTPAPAAAAGARMAAHHKVSPRHHRKAGRAPATVVAATPVCSDIHKTNFKAPLNQVDGSCTGAAHMQAISTQPFEGTAHHNTADELAAYQGGTCIDNGCATPCTCTSCKAAYCPDTHANDTGSYGSSVAQWMVNVGWLPGYTTADTVPQLLSCIANPKTIPTIGIDWRSSMWTPNAKTGRILVSLASKNEGGHDLLGIGYDMDPPDTHAPDLIVYNSWGLWGWCYNSQMTPATPTDGTGCGYARIAISDLPKLNFDADCLKSAS